MNKETLQEWLSLSNPNKLNIFLETAKQKALPEMEIEKDWWVVQTLAAVFSLDCANHLIFKGGTSLSKGWDIIHRFSEDIDLALDREFLGFSGELSKTTIKKKLRRESYKFISGLFVDELRRKFKDLNLDGVDINSRKVESQDQDPLVIEIYYPILTNKNTYLKTPILLEIGVVATQEIAIKADFRLKTCFPKPTPCPPPLWEGSKAN
jgi:hypothetical protein